MDVEKKENNKIKIEDFLKVDLRVGKVIEVEEVPGSEKLLKLLVDIGSENRKIFAGIKKWYSPEVLIGKKVIIVANLEPRKIMGDESNGMILAAEDEDNVFILTVDGDAEAGLMIH